MIEQESIDEVLERASILDVVQEVTPLKQQGGRFVGLCPFHAEKTPSFHVRPDRRMFHCFGCSVSGNTIGFVMRHYGMSFPDAIRWLAERFHIELRYARAGKGKDRTLANARYLYAVNQMALKFFSHSLLHAPVEVTSYVRERGITEAAIESFQIGYAPQGWRDLTDTLKKNRVPEELIVRSGLARRNSRGDLYDTFRGRLIFPILSSPKQVVGFGGRILPGTEETSSEKSSPKYINSSESEIYQKKRILFALPQASQRCRQTGEVWLVEGYMDVVGLWQVGITNAVATCGTAVTADHVGRLTRLVQRVNVLFDGDQAGRAAAAKLFPLFLNSGLDARVYFLDSKDDPDTVARDHGINAERFLRSLPHVSLLAAFIEYSAEQLKPAGDRELGAAAKGKLAKLVMQTIAEVKNPIERDELVREAALKLRVEASGLSDLTSATGANSPLPAAESREQVQESQTNQTVAIDSLPSADRDVLRSAMVKRHRVTEQLLRDPELCSWLHSSTLMFLHRFHDLLERFAEQPNEARSRIKEFLSDLGPSWVLHWRTSYKMEENGTDFDLLLRQAMLSLSRTRMREAISERREMLDGAPEEERLALYQEILELERELRRLEHARGA